jgi:hypothetical protein
MFQGAIIWSIADYDRREHRTVSNFILRCHPRKILPGQIIDNGAKLFGITLELYHISFIEGREPGRRK